MKTFAIVLVAGNSTRFENKISKQMFLLAGKPVFSYSLNAFAKSDLIDEVAIVTSKKHFKKIEEYVTTNKLQKAKVVLGGSTRQESVKNGLDSFAYATEDDYVIIHDGARPLIDDKIIELVIKSVKKNAAVTTALPMEDTIVTSDKNSIVEFEDRTKLSKVQTPQAFKFDLIKKAHETKTKNATDDCSLVMKMGVEVKLIPGSKQLTKITTIEDIKYLETFIK